MRLLKNCVLYVIGVVGEALVFGGKTMPIVAVDLRIGLGHFSDVAFEQLIFNNLLIN